MEIPDDFIIDHVTLRVSILKEIDPDKLYRSEELCADFWETFNGLHTKIGKRIKALSKNNKLPIQPVERTSCNKWLYRLI